MHKTKKPTVSEWRPESEPALAASRQVRSSGRVFIPSRFLGVIGTVLMHVMVMQPIILGTQAKKTRMPAAIGIGSVGQSESDVSDLTLVIVQPADAAHTADNVFDEFVSRGIQRVTLRIELSGADSIPAMEIPEQPSDDPNAEYPVTSGDPAGKAKMFGIYSHQIQARIERLWRRPRTPVNESVARAGAANEEVFQCQVRVIQDFKGNVQEVLLPKCNGTASWQTSLVAAIQQASPLPAAPDPSVFSNAIALNFTGFEYGAGSAPDDYESVVGPAKFQRQVARIRSPNLNGNFPKQEASAGVEPQWPSGSADSNEELEVRMINDRAGKKD